MIRPRDLVIYVINPVLHLLETSADKRAERAILLGTCATETHLGFYLNQMDNGAGIGPLCMEKLTYHDHFDNFINYHDELKRKLYKVIGWQETFEPPAEMMRYHLRFAFAMTRIHYMRTPDILPAFDDIEGQGKYYKKYYNTYAENAAGSVEKYIDDFLTYIDQNAILVDEMVL